VNRPSRRKYRTLDAIRGVAALLVVTYHTGRYFGAFHLPEVYLAVDLFFGLSGFVIADAYAERLAQGLGFWPLMRIRLIRLYPLYLLGTLLAILVAVGTVVSGHGNAALASRDLLAASIAAICLVPWFGSTVLFPLNAPSWSLFFELLVNAAYAACHSLLTDRRLVAVAATSALALAAGGIASGSLDAGLDWRALYVTVPRVVFSFVIGIILHRWRARPLPLRLPPWACIALAIVVLCASPPAVTRAWYDIAVVTIVFPALLRAASSVEPAAPWGEWIFANLGMVSYGIYILHVPLAALAAAALKTGIGVDVSMMAPQSGFVLWLWLIVAVWAIDRGFDQPVRRYLTKICQ